MEIVDINFLRQFETKIGGGLAIIEYSEQERKIFLTKIFVPEIKSKDEFSEKFISEVRELCTKNKIVLIFDEVTSGFREYIGGHHMMTKNYVIIL